MQLPEVDHWLNRYGLPESETRVRVHPDRTDIHHHPPQYFSCCSIVPPDEKLFARLATQKPSKLRFRYQNPPMLKVESQGKTLTKDRENINLQATGTKVFPELFGNGEAGAIRFIPSLIEQLCLLDREDHHRISATDASNATIFSTDVLKNPSWGAVLPQFALLGSASQTEVVPSEPDVDRRLFLNTNIPWSAFICGVQGGGKSHTMSCLIGL